MIRLYLTNRRISDIEAGEAVGRALIPSSAGDLVVTTADGCEVARFHTLDVIGYQLTVAAITSGTRDLDEAESANTRAVGRKRART